MILVESGAPSRYWEGAIRLLQASGTAVVLVSVRERGPLHENLEALGCRTDTLGCRTSFDYPGAIPRLAHIIRQHQIDIIHANEPIPTSICGLAGVLAPRARRIFHRHHTFAAGKQRLLSQISSHLTHLTMAVSESAAQYAHEVDRVPMSRIRVAYSGIEEPRRVSAEEVAALRGRLRIPEGAPVVSTVARLSKEKGHHTLLEAIPLMLAGLPKPPHLVFAGSGAEEQEIREHALRVSPAGVHFVGQQEDIAPWFAIADVVALPSYHESFGLSAVEAMACGRPLVASRVGGLPEVVEDEVSGILVTPRDSGALAGGILRVLQCPETATTMAKAGYQRFREKFTIEAMIRRWIGCYDEVDGPPKNNVFPKLPQPGADYNYQGKIS